MKDYYYDKEGNLFIENKKVSKEDRRSLRIIGWIYAILLILLGIAFGRWLL